MRKLLETLYNIYKIEELRDRVVLTLSLLLVYRLGAQGCAAWNRSNSTI